MAREIEEPITIEQDGPLGGTKTRHPAFAQIVASRVSGQTVLYGSDFVHKNYITITLTASELNRTLSNDWHFGRKQIIELAMSEAQWSSFVSSMNIGSGVPCTLTWQEGKGVIPGLPMPEARANQFGKEFQEDFDEAIQALKEALEEVDMLGLSKAKADRMKARIITAHRKISDAAPFVANQFGEHMEKELERAKVEIHGYATSLFQRAGIAALTDGTGHSPPPIALPDKGDA